MNKKKIELQVLNISNSQVQAGAYALALSEVNGERRLSIVIGASEAQAMIIQLKGITPSRPLTHNLFASVLEVLHTKLLRVLIYKVNNGIFYAYLYIKADETVLRIDSRTSDAVALALRMNAPIFIYEEILGAEYLKTEENNTDGEGKKENQPQDDVLDTLQLSLQKAVKEEDYEHAALLRDQINNQHKNKA